MTDKNGDQKIDNTSGKVTGKTSWFSGFFKTKYSKYSLLLVFLLVCGSIGAVAFFNPFSGGVSGSDLSSNASITSNNTSCGDNGTSNSQTSTNAATTSNTDSSSNSPSTVSSSSNSNSGTKNTPSEKKYYTLPCGFCGGTGFVNYGSDDMPGYGESCTHCGGTGTIVYEEGMLYIC